MSLDTHQSKTALFLGRTIRPGPAQNLAGAADQIAERLAVHLAPLLPAPRVASPRMDANEAASYLRCPVSRVRKLTSTRDLPCTRDGRRVLYHRDELDQFLRDGGAICP
jgi:excisionase family DNA binding protein